MKFKIREANMVAPEWSAMTKLVQNIYSRPDAGKFDVMNVSSAKA